MTVQKNETFQKLNRETGKITWNELQPHLDNDALILIDGTLDLVEVGYRFSADDKASVSEWLEQGKLARVEKHNAKDFNDEQLFWAVVVAPWVLIQICRDS